MNENDPKSHYAGAKVLNWILALAVVLVTCAVAWVGWTVVESVQKKAGKLGSLHATADNTKVDSHRYDNVQEIDRKMFPDTSDPMEAMISGGGNLEGSEVACCKGWTELLYKRPKQAEVSFSRALAMIPLEAEKKTSWHGSGHLCDRPTYTADAYRGRSISYLQTGRYPQAIADLTASIQLHRRHDSYQYRSFCYLKAGKYSLAVADSTEAIKLKATDPFDYDNRAKAYYFLGQKARADADIKAAQALPKGNVQQQSPDWSATQD
jgi:tetratricopeptide (TPR) repeat protein